MFPAQADEVAKQWAAVSSFVGLCYDDASWKPFMAHLKDIDEKKVWTWSCFREVVLNLQKEYCVSLMNWAISPLTQVCALHFIMT